MIKFKTEQDLQKHIISNLKQLVKEGWKLHYFKVHDNMTSGVSDLIICCYGRFVAAELKLPGRKPTALQKLFLKQTIDAGGVAFIIYSWEQLYSVLEDIRKEWEGDGGLPETALGGN